MLRALINRIPVRIVLIGSAAYPLADLVVERVSSSTDTEAIELAKQDVGIMTIPDLPGTVEMRVQRWIQYMASSHTVLAFPFGGEWRDLRSRRNRVPSCNRCFGPSALFLDTTCQRFIAVLRSVGLEGSCRRKSMSAEDDLPLGRLWPEHV